MYLALLVVLGAHVGMGAVDLPRLWGRRELRREFWTVLILLLIGLSLAVTLALGFGPLSAAKLLERIVGPIGTVLFKPKEH